ncbi:hypothetical protein ACQCSU_09735 [Pseudarthrobacter sp. O4]|uniref:hypothetical protein n=1 Tax=Pseudarthrobacter sp. O4 TaxID=3418417 RepID=UPI003CF1B750
MAKINKTIMLAAVIGGGAIGASAIPAMAADSTASPSSARPPMVAAPADSAARTRPTARRRRSSPVTPPRRSRGR